MSNAMCVSVRGIRSVEEAGHCGTANAHASIRSFLHCLQKFQFTLLFFPMVEKQNGSCSVRVNKMCLQSPFQYVYGLTILPYTSSHATNPICWLYRCHLALPHTIYMYPTQPGFEPNTLYIYSPYTSSHATNPICWLYRCHIALSHNAIQTQYCKLKSLKMTNMH